MQQKAIGPIERAIRAWIHFFDRATHNESVELSSRVCGFYQQCMLQEGVSDYADGVRVFMLSANKCDMEKTV